MRYINEKGQAVQLEQLDLSKGYLVTNQAIREDAEPIDNITKFAYTTEDYEEVQQYFLYRVEDTKPSQLDRIEAQIAYTAMMTDTLLEG
jgi:hypothetical protein